MDGGAWWATVHGVAKSRRRLSDFTLTFSFHALEKEMAIHSSSLDWRIPGTAEPGGLPSMGLHKVRHDWSDLVVVVISQWTSGPDIRYKEIPGYITLVESNWQREAEINVRLETTFPLVTKANTGLLSKLVWTASFLPAVITIWISPY